MQWSSLVALALVAGHADAMLRFSCSELVVERLDPLVFPGANPSPHVHQIVGGDAFNVTMDPNRDLPAESTCTTCTFSEDFSNYWTASLYFRARDGTFHRVPQMANQFLDGAQGGMTIYYIQPYDGSRVTAFRPGFRMLIGNPTKRHNDNSLEAQQTSFRCFEANFGGPNDAPGTGGDTRDLPRRPCQGGIRSNIFFPTCWDGVNVDSPDHKSHVAYPSSGSFEFGGPCPASHPVKIPQLFYEVVWDTRQFNDPNMWPTDGSQPFVFSYGDPTGYGQHADYVFGWRGDSLQKAMDANCDVFCPELQSQSVDAANRCRKQKTVLESIDQTPWRQPSYAVTGPIGYTLINWESGLNSIG
ncbi:hypothetical protein AJ80_09562 [Polytolypa hystricis UAMH7299]|uniref:DUF1996 domain-containing protein n=1 Tax=Polytolypa hystricis (strain UAMH7299) TaxID=1447883 RepID=A0A2B7WP18_POLH7|nr:hypothetical protein AJ80_09562 [Polytolypa hystricis UAMH7299]